MYRKEIKRLREKASDFQIFNYNKEKRFATLYGARPLFEVVK